MLHRRFTLPLIAIVSLLLPGFGSDVSVFARQAPELAGSYRVLGVNPRGVGLSDAPEQAAYGVGQAAADAAAVAGALEAYDGIRRYTLPMKDSPAAQALSVVRIRGSQT